MSAFKSRDKPRPSKRPGGPPAVDTGAAPPTGAAKVPVEVILSPLAVRAHSRIWMEAALFFLAIFSIYEVSPVISSGDSHFVLPTALSIIRHGDANIDEYRSQFKDTPWVAWQQNGHTWNLYPIGVPLMVVPMAWVADRISALSGVDLEAAAIQKSPMFLELTFAGIITAAAAALLFYYLRARLSQGRALLLAGLFALGTSVYSSASRGLWMHGPSMLLLIIAIFVYEKLSLWKTRGAFVLGLVAGYSYAVRPANSIVLIGFAALVAFTARPRLLVYFGGAIAGMAPLFIFHRLALGTWTSLYYRLTQEGIFSLSFPVAAFWGTLFSPSRGLFVFSPYLLFVGLRFLPSYRRRYPFTPLELMLAAISLLWWIGTARWFMWWGGGSYGPRLLCELLPCATILLIPIAANLSFEDRGTSAVTAAFVIAGLFSFGVHFRGATALAVHEWNATPVSPPVEERLWSWKDPQFLRGLTTPVQGMREFKAPAGMTPTAFYPIRPCRILDTRSPGGPFGGPTLTGGQPRLLPVPDGPCEIPRGAAAYSLNVVAIPKGPLGWLNIWAAGESMPLSSILNAPSGAPATNAAIVRAGEDGALVLQATDATDAIIDINGYFGASTPAR